MKYSKNIIISDIQLKIELAKKRKIALEQRWDKTYNRIEKLEDVAYTIYGKIESEKNYIIRLNRELSIAKNKKR